ncbi:MAG: HAMP domain-containing histidine kinase [Gammaproteobacteria bacterium]|nr:HAMP domain-containing histidine kinase [Gammaproteobacteria bacterium]
MSRNKKPAGLAAKSYFWFITVIVCLTAVFLLWITQGRIVDHSEYHHFIATESASGVTDEVARFVGERNRLVQLFADQHLELIRAVANHPADHGYYQQLANLIRQYFPGHFAFTVASAQGLPLFEDFDGLVADSCRADIKSFAEKQYYHPYIHPNYEGYHFDVMSTYGNNEGVLFVSFHADILGSILSVAQTPGHRLMLIYPAFNDLIEVVAEGARNQIERDDYRLSGEEKSRLLISMPVPETRWDVVDMHDSRLFSLYQRKLYIEAAIIFLVFLIAGIVMVRRLHKEEMQRELVEKQKQELMGIISHEFRTPASAIHGALELVTRGTSGPITGETRRLLDMARSNTRRLLTLVNDFLDLQKYESGKLHMTKQQCELQPIVENAIKNNQIYAEQFGVRFAFNNDTDAVKMHCDSARIEQVLANLLSNAAKYGASNDVIEIQVSKPATSNVRVSVTDHGEGIAPHIQNRIFEKFVMARTGKNGKVRSSGLGLSISKAIIEEHGGRISFETRAGEGTTFYFDLPLTEQEPSIKNH